MTEPYYTDDSVALYHGDCRDMLLSIDTVDVIITDPPYSEATHSSVRSRQISARDRGAKYGADERRVVDLGFAHLGGAERADVAAQFGRLKPRWCLAFSDIESCHLWRADLEVAGLDYVRTGIWVRENGAPQFSGDRPATGAEAITITAPKGRKRWNGGGRRGVWTHPIVMNRDGNTPRLHSTQKPLALMAELVALFSDPGELILDAYAGSGTTLVAARNAGRRAIGMEKQEAHCETIAKRLAGDIGRVENQGALL